MSLSSTGYRYINRLIAATRDHEMKGSMHPDDQDEIENRFLLTRKLLRQYVWGLEETVKRLSKEAHGG